MSHHLEYVLIELLNQTIPSANATLWIVDENLAPDQLQAIHPRPDLYAITNRFEIGEALTKRGLQVCIVDFDFSALPVQLFDRIVYRVSKERALVHHCINESFKRLITAGSLHLLGHKEDGIKTNGKNAEQVFHNTARLKKHGTAYSMTLVKKMTENSQWLDSKDYGQLRECNANGLTFTSKPGVFGWNKIDHGSELLVQEARKLLQQRTDAGAVLDLGCGYGYLLLVTADLPFTRRAATDNNAAAVHAARANFAQRNLLVQVSLDDCASHLLEQFDVILCNPPFHQGFSTSSALAEKFLQQIRRLLTSKGVALVVVNQFIPLERVATAWFQRIETLCHVDGFKVVLLGQERLA